MPVRGTALERAISKFKLLLVKLRLKRTGLEKVAGTNPLVAEERKLRRLFKRRKRVPGTNLKVTAPTVLDGAADEYYVGSSAPAKLDPPLPPPAMKYADQMNRFGNDAAVAPDPVPALGDPSASLPPAPKPLSKRGHIKKLYREARAEGKGRIQSRSESRSAVKEVIRKAKEEKKQAIRKAKQDKASELAKTSAAREITEIQPATGKATQPEQKKKKVKVPTSNYADAALMSAAATSSAAAYTPSYSHAGDHGGGYSHAGDHGGGFSHAGDHGGGYSGGCDSGFSGGDCGVGSV